MESTQFRAILQKLASHHVEFIIVGGVAAALGGVPAQTFDLDIVHSRAPENVARLVAVLTDLEARYRYNQNVRPNESHLSAAGHLLLLTRLGRLDVLGSIGKGRTYPDLLPHSHLVEIGNGVEARVLDLETVIATKEEAGRDKDDRHLATLRATLAEIRRQQRSTTSE